MSKILLPFLLIVAMETPAQEFPSVSIPNSQVRELPSTIVGISYKLYIKLPLKYDAVKHYDVIFLLDPEYSFAIASNITDHLIQRNDLPDVIIVGIGYMVDNYRVNRTRDYTPTQSLVEGYGEEIQKHSGGGASFFKFITEELLPFVEKNYGKPKTTTLVGHSYGGLFSLWVLFTKPGTFNRFIIVSPSLWYDNKRLLKSIENNPDAIKAIKAKAYMTVGASEERRMSDDLVYLKGILTKLQASEFVYRIDTADNENHNTVFPRAFSNGLRYTFGVR